VTSFTANSTASTAVNALRSNSIVRWRKNVRLCNMNSLFGLMTSVAPPRQHSECLTLFGENHYIYINACVRVRFRSFKKEMILIITDRVSGWFDYNKFGETMINDCFKSTWKRFAAFSSPSSFKSNNSKLDAPRKRKSMRTERPSKLDGPKRAKGEGEGETCSTRKI